jgi:hypothetical protein
MYATAGSWNQWTDDGFPLHYDDEAKVLWNSSASCVQGNHVINDSSMCDPSVSVYDSNLLFNSTDVGLAAIVLAGSRLRFAGTGHNFGGNHAEGNTSFDLVAYPQFAGELYMKHGHMKYDRGTNYTGGFGCSGRVTHHGAYSTAYTMRVEGDVCAETCKGPRCSCKLGSKWSEAACKCV